MPSATPNQTKRNSRLFLTVKPVNFSLTDGTNIPPPPPSPPIANTTTSAGNNFTPQLPGSFPESPIQHHARKNSAASTVDSETNKNIAATAAANPHRNTPDENPPRPSTALRRMFSLGSLRQSFSSSRTSLALPRSSNDALSGRPKSPSVASTMAPHYSEEKGENNADYTGGRPGTSASKKRRGSWFGRRKSSGLWNTAGGISEGGGGAGLESVQELTEEGGNGTIGGAKGGAGPNKRSRGAKYAAPRLPDVGTLRGGRLDGGQLGWNDDMFRKEEENMET